MRVFRNTAHRGPRAASLPLRLVASAGFGAIGVLLTVAPNSAEARHHLGFHTHARHGFHVVDPSRENESIVIEATASADSEPAPIWPDWILTARPKRGASYWRKAMTALRLSWFGNALPLPSASIGIKQGAPARAEERYVRRAGAVRRSPGLLSLDGPRAESRDRRSAHHVIPPPPLHPHSDRRSQCRQTATTRSRPQ